MREQAKTSLRIRVGYNIPHTDEAERVTNDVRTELFTNGGQRIARWKAGKRIRTAKVTTGRDGSERIVTKSTTYFASHRDGKGFVCDGMATDCRDEAAARAVLTSLEKRAEKVRSGIITSARRRDDHSPADTVDGPFAEFIATLQTTGRSESQVTRTPSRCVVTSPTNCGSGWRALRPAGSANVLTFRRDTVPVELPASMPLLNVLKAFCKILDRDLKTAGISKRDDRGCTIDVHVLRHTSGTMLSMAGVARRVAQAAMRHSSTDLTMNI